MLGITDQTYYRWRKEFGGVKTDQAKRLKELERENARLKRLLADAELDKAILARGRQPKLLSPQRKRQVVEHVTEHLRGEPAAGLSGFGPVTDDPAVSAAGSGR